jgi:acetyltransferase-like isoleucine patch superfamily enzyme
MSISGGTDILGCFVLGNPNVPVRRGEIQCRSLGLDVAALPDPADPSSPVGELVCRNPFPSRPLGLFGDDDGSAFHAAYFAQNPGVWTHGDRIEFTDRGTARIHGRSDAVLLVHGVRIGPAEITRPLADLPEIREAMAVQWDAPDLDGGNPVVLLIVPSRPGAVDDGLRLRIRRTLVTAASAAHVPGAIVEVPELPTTHSGKLSERAAREAVNGREAANRDTLRNPASLDAIRAALRAAPGRPSPTAPAEDAAGTAEEAVVREVWESLLGLSAFGRHDSFFDLGGTSLQAMRLVEALNERLGVDVPLSVLQRTPTVAGMAAVVAQGQVHAAAVSEPYRPPSRGGLGLRRRVLDPVLRALLVTPLVLAHRLGLVRFSTVGQALAGVPGRLGMVVRAGWYAATLEHCGADLWIEHGSVIVDARTRIGDRVGIGALCRVRWAEIGDDALIASHVAVLDGARQHGITDLTRPMRDQPGREERVTIGADVWIGAGCVVMADVAPHSIVAPGSSVGRTFDPYDVLSGVPARPVANRRRAGR